MIQVIKKTEEYFVYRNKYDEKKGINNTELTSHKICTEKTNCQSSKKNKILSFVKKLKALFLNEFFGAVIQKTIMN